MNYVYSFFKGKCPRCHQGDVFESSNPFKINKMLTTKNECSVCHLNFVPEPGFYWGATYVSYMLTVAFSVATFVASTVFFGFMNSLSLNYVIVNGVLLIILSPMFYRLSRMIWLWMFYNRD